MMEKKEKKNYTTIYILFVIALLWIVFLTIEASESTAMYYTGWTIAVFCTAWFAIARIKKQKWSDIYFTLFLAIVYTAVFYITK